MSWPDVSVANTHSLLIEITVSVPSCMFVPNLSTILELSRALLLVK